MNVAATTAAAQASSAATNSSQTAASDPTSLATESTFLKLLVAQIQNQDPTQPADSMAYVTQLAQFSSLEQLININQGVTTLDQAVAPSSNGGSTPPVGGTTQPVNNS
jgi:flagellar basal-body rod modification protein FlgD